MLDGTSLIASPFSNLNISNFKFTNEPKGGRSATSKGPETRKPSSSSLVITEVDVERSRGVDVSKRNVTTHSYNLL